MSLTLIDATNKSLTVSWTGGSEGNDTTRYILQYRKANEAEAAFQTLSETLTTSQARKKNLVDPEKVGFIFRVKCVSGDKDATWITHSEPFYLLTDEDESKRLPSPSVSLGGTNQALLIQWKGATANSVAAYELQMRENVGGEPWKTIATSFSGTEVRKKNLTSVHGYQFRFRPVSTDEKGFPFSPPSEAVVALGVSEGIKNLFRSLENGSLLRADSHLCLADAVGGKDLILLYASAHWCGPCRQATPMLVNWYNSLGANKTIEMVFLSADHDEQSFKSYYKSMPWLAIDFEDETREQLMGFLQVKGIPQLAVLDGRTGRILETNAIGKPLDVNRWRSIAAAK
jgi:thiol-disulfide isomerase/thioredoxin